MPPTCLPMSTWPRAWRWVDGPTCTGSLPRHCIKAPCTSGRCTLCRSSEESVVFIPLLCAGRHQAVWLHHPAERGLCKHAQPRGQVRLLLLLAFALAAAAATSCRCCYCRLYPAVAAAASSLPPLLPPGFSTMPPVPHPLSFLFPAGPWCARWTASRSRAPRSQSVSGVYVPAWLSLPGAAAACLPPVPAMAASRAVPPVPRMRRPTAACWRRYHGIIVKVLTRLLQSTAGLFTYDVDVEGLANLRLSMQPVGGCSSSNLVG